MAYFIFLKSSRSLEEFRKNSHVKIPPKSSCANFQSLGILKKSNFIRKSFFPPIPAQPAQPQPLRPQAAVRALGPLGLSSLGIFAKRCLFFEFVQSVNGVSSHVAANWAPPIRSTPFLAPTDLNYASPRASPQLIASRLLASIIAMPIKAPYSPALIPPLESSLTPPPPPAINGVGLKSPAVTHWHFHPEHPRPPIKGEHPHRVSPHLSPLLLPSLHA
jgi:hypothetical protein